MGQQAYEYRGTAKRYIFTLAKRQLASAPLVSDIFNNFSSREFFVDQPMEIFIACCDAGLREAKHINVRAFRDTCERAHSISHSAPIYFISYDDLKGIN